MPGASRTRAMAARRSYVSPFTTRAQIDGLEQRYLQADAERPYPDSAALGAGAAIRQRTNLRTNLQIVFRWKLEAFLKRFRWVAAFPAGIADDHISEAVETALAAIEEPGSGAAKAVQAFDDLPWVGVPVTSAFLMAIDPGRFTVIDRQAYKALGVAFPASLGVGEYLSYLDFCRREAARFDASLRSYDRALWQYGKELGRRPKKRRPCGAGESRPCT